jgi:hypothetical protein
MTLGPFDLLRDRGVDVEALRVSEEQWQAARARTEAAARRVHLPPNWKRLPEGRVPKALEGVACYECTDGRFVALSAGCREGRWWLHASVSRKREMPSYWDMADLKAIFIGPDLQALQVFPRLERHVNIHPYCLHLWACLEPEGDGLPDFGKDGTI